MTLGPSPSCDHRPVSEYPIPTQAFHSFSGISPHDSSTPGHEADPVP